jgi:hypothetical protein
MKKQLTLCIAINAAIIIFLCVYAFLIPAGMMIHDLRDPGLYSDKMPRCVFRWHKALSPKYEQWARSRVKSKSATKLTTSNISGTEWPVFGSVFYLWATEALQEGYQENPKLASSAPNKYAQGAIAEAAALIADPNHASWVKDHWGQAYLEKENLFYRMLLISGLTSYQKLTGNTQYEELLYSQVESLSNELDESPYGLLDDYPGQCYPVDILPAIAAIRRADTILGTDHREFAARSIRGFQDARLDEDTGLPAYFVDSRTGRAKDIARGVGLSFMLIWAPELWPETAQEWYTRYEKQFWQQGRFFAGFREYAKDVDAGFFSLNDVDAGPVICGYGAAACAFGIGAARAMGRLDHAYALTAEAMISMWPLPNGTLLGPRFLSNLSDAPYLGEAAVLFALTRKPVNVEEVIEEVKTPGFVYTGILFFVCIGFIGILSTIIKTRRIYKRNSLRHVPSARLQFSIWLTLVIIAVFVWMILSVSFGLIILLTAQFIPIGLKKQSHSK